jgi:hypothetical protein
MWTEVSEEVSQEVSEERREEVSEFASKDVSEKECRDVPALLAASMEMVKKRTLSCFANVSTTLVH